MYNEEKIQEIIDRYYNQDEEYYSQYRYEECDGGEIEFDMKVEIEEYLKSVNAVYSISFEEGYSSCSYDNDFLAIAWLCNGEIKMKTIVLETY